MKKLLIALAGAASFAALADVTASQSDFEGITAETLITAQQTDANWRQADGDPASKVTAYAAAAAEEGVKADYAGSWGSPLATAYGSNYLALDTGGGELLRYLAGYTSEVVEEATVVTPNTVSVTDEAPVYIDTMVQFTATDSSTEVEIASDAKLAIWMVGTENDGTTTYTLKVRGGQYHVEGADEEQVMTWVAKSYTATGSSYLPNTWYRLTVKAVRSLLAPQGDTWPGFIVYIDGEPLVMTENVYDATLTDEHLTMMKNASVLSAENETLLKSKKFIPSAVTLASGDPVTLASVGFQGSGALDDFIMTTTAPNFISTTALDFTLAWTDTAITAVSYTITSDGTPGEAQTATSGTPITGLNVGDVVTVTPTFNYPNAYQATYTPSVAGKVTASGNAFTVAALGSVTVTVAPEQIGLTGLGSSEDPYKIGSTAEFGFWKAGLGTTYPANGNYKLTGNIDCDGATGIAVNFTGVFDGDNHTISNFTLSDADGYEKWVGFFSRLTGATIQNVKFNATISSDSTSVGRAIAVGTADGTSSLINVTTMGSVSAFRPASGLVGQVHAANGTLSFTSCTNLANVTCTGYDKASGFFNYAQNATANVSFTDCYNNGTIACNSTKSDKGGSMAGGFVAFGWNTILTFTDCRNDGAIGGVALGAGTGNTALAHGGFFGRMDLGATLTRCVNTGAITGSAQAIVDVSQSGLGGLGGQYGYNNHDVTITDCSNSGTITYTKLDAETVVAGSLLGVRLGGTLTATGTNTAQDSLKPLGSGTCAALNFATVDNGVATFCAAPTAPGSYKVMLANSDAITIASGAANDAVVLDTSLAAYSGSAEGETPTVTTTVSGLSITTTTGEGLITYTLAGGTTTTYPEYIAETDADVKAAYDTWKTTYAADADSTKEDQFVLNVAPATEIPATALAITEIKQNATAGWDITVECTIQGVDLGGTVGTARVGNGYLAVSYAETLGGTWTTENIVLTASANGKVTVNVNKAGAKFMKVKLSAKQEAAASAGQE